MKGLVILTIMLGCSCGREPANRNTLSTSTPAVSHPDLHVMAVIESDDAEIFFLEGKHQSFYLMITVVPDQPAFTDTLMKKENGLLVLKGKQNSFRITEDAVIRFYHQKIIHPSSNWQGQTPGQTDVVTRYRRKDIP